MIFWAWLAGCGLGLEFRIARDTGTIPPPDTEVEVEVPDLEVEPPSLDLGETDVGEPTSGTLTLTNTGDHTLYVVDLGAGGEDDFALSLLDAPLLLPGASVEVEVEWTPSMPGAMSSAVSLSVGDTPDDAEPVEVPVSGTAVGANATVSTLFYDFGQVGIDCTDELTVTLTNTGNLAMEVTGVGLHGEEGYAVDQPDDLPWVLGPFQSHEQVVRFVPDDLGLMNGELIFTTDLGEIATALQGEGVVEEERTLSFEVGDLGRSTFIVNVNNTAIPGSSEDMYSRYFVDALPTFFQTLQDNHTSFRAAFVWNVAGTVDGDYDYIDESFSVTEANDAALAMIAPGVSGGDNDANFRTILNAIAVNSDWLFEDATWAESRLCLFTIQRDTEASGGSWTNWVSQAQAYKDDPADIMFHAIAGPVPGGCGGAEAFCDYDKAITATGGLLLSVCATDWTTHMAQIATACMDGASTIFPLEGNPMASSIEVYVDGFRETEGWSYDDHSNAVVFEESAYPAYSATVEIYYWMSGSCG